MFDRQSQKGFTLLELMVVVAVIGILSALASWQVQSMLPKFRSKAAAQEFAKYMDLCRNISIRTNKECKITLLDWDSSPASLGGANAGKYSISLGDKAYNSSSWDILPEDTFDGSSDQDQTEGIIDLSTGNHELHKVSMVYTSGDIGGPGIGMSDSLIFAPRGYLRNPGTDFNATGYIEVSFANKQALSEGVNDVFVVMISKMGMTRLDNRLGRKYSHYVSGTSTDSSK